MAKRQLTFALIVAAVVASLAGAALATPSSGVLTSTVVARAAFADRVNMRFAIRDHHRGREVIQVREAQDTVMQQIVLAPNGQTGWHSHPGPAVALIKAGELTLYSEEDGACSGRTYSAGQAFVDTGQGHVHIARNLSPTQNAEVWVTYFDVPPHGAFRLDAAAPGNCPS